VTLVKTNRMDGYGFTQEPQPKDKKTPKGWPEFLIIGCVVKDGLLDAWNRAHPDSEVQAGDRIVKVDTCKGVKAMEKALLRDQVKLTICRFPDQFDVVIKKQGQPLGVKVENPDNEASSELCIIEIFKDGCIPEWNASALKAEEWYRIILPGMHIIAANHAAWDAEAITNEIRISEEVCLTIRRAAPVNIIKQCSAGIFQPSSPPAGFQPQILVNEQPNLPAFSGVTQEHTQMEPETYKVVHSDGANVRKDYNVASKSICTLPKGTIVVVEQVSDRRARIVKPVEGWVSTYSSNGKLILELRQKDDIRPSEDCPRNYLITHKNGAQVRAGYEINSKATRKLPTGSVVTVVEIRERRAHILKPIDGWVSTHTKEDLEILSPQGEANLASSSGSLSASMAY
jgi:hypothetical protein